MKKHCLFLLLVFAFSICYSQTIEISDLTTGMTKHDVEILSRQKLQPLLIFDTEYGIQEICSFKHIGTYESDTNISILTFWNDYLIGYDPCRSETYGRYYFGYTILGDIPNRYSAYNTPIMALQEKTILRFSQSTLSPYFYSKSYDYEFFNDPLYSSNTYSPSSCNLELDRINQNITPLDRKKINKR